MVLKWLLYTVLKIKRLKQTILLYQDLEHENLIRFIEAKNIGGGYAAVFEWVDAECMGRMYPLSRKKFMQMSVETKMQVYSDILKFHMYVASQGYVAIDFYDGSIMYDFENKRTIICDIDFYSKSPYTNHMGRMWGSSRFMSPEEFTMYAEIDEITNVYTMGATIFELFSGYDRTDEKWNLNKTLFEVAKKAVSDDRSRRQQSIKQLFDEWEMAKRILD